MNRQTCAWCDGPLPPRLTLRGTHPYTYCSKECDTARRIRRDTYAEEVEHLASMGIAPATIIQQLGVKPGSLERALHRAGRHDLAAILAPLACQKAACVDCGTPLARAGRQRCRPCYTATRRARSAA
jgi:hypothetical protein